MVFPHNKSKLYPATRFLLLKLLLLRVRPELQLQSYTFHLYTRARKRAHRRYLTSTFYSFAFLITFVLATLPELGAILLRSPRRRLQLGAIPDPDRCAVFAVEPLTREVNGLTRRVGFPFVTAAARQRHLDIHAEFRVANEWDRD